MFNFNSPYGNFSHICVPEEISAGRARTMIGGFSCYGFQPHPIALQRTQLWDSNSAMFFAREGQTVNTERSLRPSMEYPVKEFFECHKNFSEGLISLINQSSDRQIPCSNFYNPISDIISEYDQNLMHLPDDILYIFFDYTDLLEAVLLVSKRRHVDVAHIKDILEKLNDNYSKIYSLMMSNNRNDISSVTDELSNIKEEIRNRGLLPTDAEYDAEISEISTTLNDEEKEDLACMFTRQD